MSRVYGPAPQQFTETSAAGRSGQPPGPPWVSTMCGWATDDGACHHRR